MLTEMWNFMHYETLSLNKMSAIFRKNCGINFFKSLLAFFMFIFGTKECLVGNIFLSDISIFIWS